jgi:hypothetical protein
MAERKVDVLAAFHGEKITLTHHVDNVALNEALRFVISRYGTERPCKAKDPILDFVGRKHLWKERRKRRERDHSVCN